MRLALSLTFLVAAVGHAQEAKPKPTPGKVTAVTVYQNTALVTRELAAPEAMGQSELLVSPLPTSVVSTSLYAEGTDGVRVLSARYRERAVTEDNRAEVRALEAKLKALQQKRASIEADLAAGEQNSQLLTKLETFTAASLQSLTEKGQLDPEKVIALTTYIRETRAKSAKDKLAIQQELQQVQEGIAFETRVLKERSGGVNRTERDAILTLDRGKPGAGTIRLSYLVTNATWRPQYKLRAGTKVADPVTVEYLAGVTQETGEDWTDAELTLSTAEPLLNAAPPELRPLNVVATANGVPLPGAVPSPGLATQNRVTPLGGLQGGQIGGMAGNMGFGGGLGGGAGNMPNATAYQDGLKQQAQDLRQQATDNFNARNPDAGNTLQNNSAAVESYRELVADREDLRRPADAGLVNGPSVTYRLKSKLTIPSRPDDHILEIARLELAPTFYYQAVPVLTPNVYRIADLVNKTEFVLLPGEATTYLGGDFVGQTQLPLVAAGKPFTVGFGVDPQLQATRKIIDRTRTTQGGNQVVDFKYQILLNSYKTGVVDVRVLDRMPFSEATGTIGVTLLKGGDELSKNALYLRDERPKNILRWDITIGPKQNGDKAKTIDYEYKLEFAQSVNIGAFLSR